MNVKDNCLIFHMNLKCLKMLNKNCQRTTYFHSLKIVLIIDMLIQIITLKYNLNYKSNSNIVKSLAKWGKRIPHNVNPRPLHLASLTSLTLPNWLAHGIHLLTYYPHDSPPLSFVTPQLVCYTPTGTFFCFFSSSIPLTPAYYPYQFLPFLIVLHVYWVPSGFLCYFRDWSMQFYV